jgi:regulator of protease activity HflC (stomatin/prohibitin superfamily)
MLVVLALLLVALGLFLAFFAAAVRIAREDQRAVIFRLGRLLEPPKGPGLFIVVPVIDRSVKVDVRERTIEIPPQEMITQDNVPVRVDAAASFHVVDPSKAIVKVENFTVATSQVAQTVLRSVVAEHQFDELLSNRDRINAILQENVAAATAAWGVEVSSVEVKNAESLRSKVHQV